MNDEQPTQPLTDAELMEIREDYEGVDPYDSVPRLLAEVDRLRTELDAATNGQQSCGDASIWSCALGDHCVCKKTKHGGRHECACGSWWFRDK